MPVERIISGYEIATKVDYIIAFRSASILDIYWSQLSKAQIRAPAKVGTGGPGFDLAAISNIVGTPFLVERIGEQYRFGEQFNRGPECVE